MQTFPSRPPAGPVIETLAAPSSNTVQPDAAPSPSDGSTQAGQGGGPCRQTALVTAQLMVADSLTSVVLKLMQAALLSVPSDGSAVVSTQAMYDPAQSGRVKK